MMMKRKSGGNEKRLLFLFSAAYRRSFMIPTLLIDYMACTNQRHFLGEYKISGCIFGMGMSFAFAFLGI
jgi:hypothetical protein